MTRDSGVSPQFRKTVCMPETREAGMAESRRGGRQARPVGWERRRGERKKFWGGKAKKEGEKRVEGGVRVQKGCASLLYSDTLHRSEMPCDLQPARARPRSFPPPPFLRRNRFAHLHVDDDESTLGGLELDWQFGSLQL